MSALVRRGVRWLHRHSSLAAAVCSAALCSPAAIARADTATYDDVAGSQESAQIWDEITAGQDLPDVQMRGPLPRPALALVATRLGHVPLGAVQRADAAPARNWLFAGRLTDLPGFEHLRGVKPTGWPDGYTWDTVGGAGAGAPGGGMAVNPNAEGSLTGQGAFSLSLHEYGHVLDRVFAEPPQILVSDSDRWRTGPFAELTRVGEQGWFRQTPGYFLNSAAEWWAGAIDLFTVTPEHHEFMRTTYPETWQFLRDTLGAPRFEIQFVTPTPTAVAPPAQVRPEITGRGRVGSTLRCRPGSFTGTVTVSIVWRRTGRPIAGATRPTYKLSRRDRGRLISCRTIVSNSAGTTTSVSRGVRVRR